MQKHGDPPAAIVEEIGGSINQSGLFPSDGGAPEESGGEKMLDLRVLFCMFGK